jgi:hypothetical protein
VLFNGTNYCDWIPRMRLHMRGIRLWEFLSGEVPCPALPTPLVQPVIPARTQKLIKRSCEKLPRDEAQDSMETINQASNRTSDTPCLLHTRTSIEAKLAAPCL